MLCCYMRRNGIAGNDWWLMPLLLVLVRLFLNHCAAGIISLTVRSSETVLHTGEPLV